MHVKKSTLENNTLVPVRENLLIAHSLAWLAGGRAEAHRRSACLAHGDLPKPYHMLGEGVS
jgi:hypothetical protein